MPFTSGLALVAFATAAAAATGPAADPPAPPICPNGDAPTGEMAELVHVSRLRSLDVVNGHGVLTLEDVVENRSASAASIELPLGQGGVVRAASVEEPGFAPRDARLDDEDAAIGEFDAYTQALMSGVPPEDVVDAPERAAILVTDGGHGSRSGEPSLSVVMPCSVRAVTVRVEMLVPSVPVDGMWRFALPGDPGEGIADTIVVDSAAPIRAFLEDDVIMPGEMRAVPALDDTAIDEDGAVTVTVRPLVGPKLRTRGYALRIDPTAAPRSPLEVVDLEWRLNGDSPADSPADERVAPVVVTRTELDLPRPLSSAPAGLRIVFVVDNSVSVRDAGVAKALQIVDAVLDEAPPDTRFAVVTAGRKPRVVVPPWQARDDRTIPPIALENGSDVLGALAKARAIAGDVRADEDVPRIIAISDMQLRFVDDDARVAAGFGGAEAPLTHVVTVADGDVETSFQWARAFADDEPRAAGPESTGGIWIDAGDEDEAALFPHLIAPTRVDRPRVMLGAVDVLGSLVETTADGIEEHGGAHVVLSPRDDDVVVPHERHADLPERLHAGSGLRVDVVLFEGHDAFASVPLSRGGRDLRVEGQLWATPFREVVKRDESLLGLAAVNPLADKLDDDLVRTIARRAQTVSRVTALVEVPEFRPAQPELGGLGGRGYGCSCGCGCCGGFGFGRGVTIGHGADLQERETLEDLLREDARACLVPRAIVDVEFGDQEILAVTERAGGACVVERFWQRRLDRLARVVGAFMAHREMTIGTDTP